MGKPELGELHWGALYNLRMGRKIRFGSAADGLNSCLGRSDV